MNIAIKDYATVYDIMPAIESDNSWTITITFFDGSCVVYGYINEDDFKNDYKELTLKWREFYGKD